MIFKNLPNEIIHIILQYDGKIKYRFGMYINQINTNIIKYNSLKENIISNYWIINRIQIHMKHFMNINYMNNTFKNKYIQYRTIIEWLNIRKVIHPFTFNTGITYHTNYNIAKIMSGLSSLSYCN
jgi:hypothetical protein